MKQLSKFGYIVFIALLTCTGFYFTVGNVNACHNTVNSAMSLTEPLNRVIIVCNENGDCEPVIVFP